MTSKRGPRLLASFCLVIGILLAGSSIAAPGYELTVAGSIDSPERTVTIRDASYRISSIGHVEPGDRISADVTLPDSTEFSVLLYNTDQQIVDRVRGTGDRQGEASASFDTTYLAPGSYVLALSVDGTIEALHPVVVEGYAFGLQSPRTAEQSERIAAAVDVTPDAADESPVAVEFVLSNDTWAQRTRASATEGDTYEASLAVDIAPGEYRLYAVARGTETMNGRQEIAGISSVRTLTVTADRTTIAPSTTRMRVTTTAEVTTEAGTSTVRSDTGTGPIPPTSAGATVGTRTSTTDLPNTETGSVGFTTGTRSGTTTGTTDRAVPTSGATEPAGATRSRTALETTTESLITPGSVSGPGTTTAPGMPGFTVALGVVAVLGGLATALRTL